MKKIKILAGSGLMFLGGFSQALAADLVPCGQGKEPCTICHVLMVANNIFNFFVRISIGIALLLIVIAGILYITSSGSEGMMTMAKTALKFAIIGFIVTLLAWLFVNVLAHALGYKSPSGEWWNLEVNCTPHENAELGV